MFMNVLWIIEPLKEPNNFDNQIDNKRICL